MLVNIVVMRLKCRLFAISPKIPNKSGGVDTSFLLLFLFNMTGVGKHLLSILMVVETGIADFYKNLNQLPVFEQFF